MTVLEDSGSFLRRGQDFPLLVLSQDYELFFGQSGSIDKCLFEPSQMLAEFAQAKGMAVTFFVDAGMLCCMERLATECPSLAKDLSRIKRHIESLAQSGHEIGLHIHPHWEDTRRVDGAWDFSETRYQLKEFSNDEIVDVVARYANVLNELCDGGVSSYRAGGFCVEPFDVLRPALEEQGITIDSSVVPGLRINDKAKGVDFKAAPDKDWWNFDASPSISDEKGSWLEIPITPLVLSPFHYWGRAIDRVLGRMPATILGDGSARAIGRAEIIRRLTGRGRTSELSIDAPKVGRLMVNSTLRQDRSVWHVMGHPKLLGKASLDALGKFINWKEISRIETVSGLAAAVRAQD